MGKRKAKPAEIKGDPRVVAMLDCMLFALNSFKNKPVFDQKTHTMTSWHGWFKEVITGAGYALADPKKEPEGTP